MTQSTKLYVGNLNYNTSEDSLREAFSADGRQVVSVSIITDKHTGQPRGFAFVEMESPEDAQSAIDALHGQDLDGRALTVNEARERVAGGGGGGHHRGGGGRNNANRGGGSRETGRSGPGRSGGRGDRG